MKMKIAAFLLLLFSHVAYSYNINDIDGAYTNLRDPYFGQKPPTISPITFRPFGPDKAGEFIFSKDADKCIFIRDFKLYYTEMIDSRWLKPEEISFANFKNEGIFGIGVTQNWDELFFNSFHPVPEGSKKSRVPIWMVKTANSFASDAPAYLGFGGMYVSIAANNTLYFTTWVDGKACIGRSIHANGAYQKTEILPPPIQSEFEDRHPCISPDESFLIFNSPNRPREVDSALYISFFKNNTWTEPLHLGEYITQKNASMPRLSFDGKYLFFNDAEGDYYWISTQFIDDLRQSGIESP